MEIKITTDGTTTATTETTNETTTTEITITVIVEAETKITTEKDPITTPATTNPSEAFEIMTFQTKEKKWTNVLRDSILVKIVMIIIIDKTLIQVG